MEKMDGNWKITNGKFAMISDGVARWRRIDGRKNTTIAPYSAELIRASVCFVDGEWGAARFTRSVDAATPFGGRRGRRGGSETHFALAPSRLTRPKHIIIRLSRPTTRRRPQESTKSQRDTMPANEKTR